MPQPTASPCSQAPAQARLDGVAEGVAQVQDGAQAGLAFVLLTTCAFSSQERRMA